VKDIYKNFKKCYKIPKNFLEMIKNSTSLSYYLNDEERNHYINLWQSKSTDEDYTPYTDDEYNLYNKITLENHHMSEIQTNHYMDCGCICLACQRKRKNVLEKAKRGEKVIDRIIHEETKTEFIIEKVNMIKNRFISNIKNIKTNKRVKIIKNNFSNIHNSL